MYRVSLVAIAFSAALSILPNSVTADGPPARDTDARTAPFSWTGMYVGYHVGGALDKTDFSNPYGVSIFGDDVRSPGPIAGLQVGFNKQFGATVIGLEADISWADLDGTSTCLQPAFTYPAVPAFTGAFFGATCHVHVNWFGTLAGRLGWAVGPSGRTLLFAKAGVAWVDKDVDMTINNFAAGFFGPPNARTSLSSNQWGWTVGAGLEYALTGNWSAKLEYDFLRFGNESVVTPTAGPFASPAFPGIAGSGAPDGRAARMDQDIHAIKLGVNYRLGGTAAPWLSDSAFSIKDTRTAPSLGPELEMGVRYVHGWGRFQKDIDSPNISRLTYDDLKTNGAEVFWRLDTPYNVLIKGLVGAGRGGGIMNDEDWGIPDDLNAPTFIQPYSNTLQDVDNRINYATIDVGYDWLRGAGYKVASFIGYNYYRNNMDAFGCTVVVLTPPIACPGIGPDVLSISEHDKWHSLRVGAAGDFMLSSRLKLSGDVAYLPYVKFEGVDVHTFGVFNTPTTRLEKGHGTGVQLEAMLSYVLNDQFSVGVGGRYWSMWTTEGQTTISSCGGCASEGQTFKRDAFKAEQAALLLQATYKFGVPPQPTK